MDKNILSLIPRVKEIFEKGENIIQYLKNSKRGSLNTIEDILISYDFQSGSYIKFVEENPVYSNDYTNAIEKVISALGSFDVILEAGVGEATTLVNLIPKLNNSTAKYMGFDISWSRINYGNKYSTKKSVKTDLFVADLFNIPLKDSSVDVVYTSHSIEPNGGREKEAIIELFRITKNYLILLEPTNQFANEDGKARMKKNGYVQNLIETIKELGYNIIEYRPFEVTSNPFNPTGLYIIKKEGQIISDVTTNYCCPISKDILIEYPDHFYSEKSLVSYPKIMGIPCLCESYGILTSKHE